MSYILLEGISKKKKGINHGTISTSQLRSLRSAVGSISKEKFEAADHFKATAISINLSKELRIL